MADGGGHGHSAEQQIHLHQPAAQVYYGGGPQHQQQQMPVQQQPQHHQQQQQQYYGQPMTQQHQQIQYSMPTAQVLPGMEHMIYAQQLLVKQKKDMLEVFAGWEQNNRYEIFDEAGRQVYYAAEDSSGYSLFLCGENRPFRIRIFDALRRQIVVLDATVDCCTQQVTVQVPEGNLVAVIDKEMAFMTPSFYIRDANGAALFKVKSPMSAALGSFGDVNFDIISMNTQTVIGQISKQWGGLGREMFSRADTFGLSMPRDMDVTWKAVLLAMTFHIDFTFYERRN